MTARDLGYYAVKAGLITEEQLQDCRTTQNGSSIEKVMLQKGLVSEAHLNALKRKLTELRAQRDAQASGQTPAVSAKTLPRKSTRSIPAVKASRRGSASLPAVSRKTKAGISSNKIIGIALAAAPALALMIYVLAFRGAETNIPAPAPVAAPEPETPPAEHTKADSDNKTEELRAPVEAIEFKKARIRLLPESDDTARAWNSVARQLAQARAPEQYVPHVRTMESILSDAKGKKYHDVIRIGLVSVYRSISTRAEYIYQFLGEEAERFARAGKYGEALQTWDAYPLILDIDQLYAMQIEEKKQAITKTAFSAYEKLKADADAAIAANRPADAKRLILQGLEIGIPEIIEDAYDRLENIVAAADLALRAAEEKSIRAFESEIREQREAGRVLELLRNRFWELIAARRVDTVAAFLDKETTGDRATIEGYKDAIEALRKTLTRVESAYDAIGSTLKSRVGKTLTLTFAEPSGPQVQTVHLQAIEGRTLVIQVSGKEVRRPLWDLHATQIQSLSAKLASSSDKALCLGLAQMLQNDFATAHETFAAAGKAGTEMIAFVEASTSFLEGNAPTFWARAADYEKNEEYDKAYDEYSRLVSIPSHRNAALKARAQAAYRSGKFVAAVLDVESLFDAGVVDPDIIKILNQSYQRATLIDKAIRIYENAQKKFPRDGRIVTNLVLLYMRIHEYDKAQNALELARKLKQSDPRLGEVAALLPKVKEPAFAGRTYWARVGRYRVETSVNQEKADELARFMDKVYKDYKTFFPHRRNETLVFHVKIFKDFAEYNTYYKFMNGESAEKEGSRVVAYYMPTTKELVGWVSDDIQETLQHEGLHQFMDYYVEECPIWFNEGYASFFEKSTATTVGFNPSRHRSALYMLQTKQAPSLKNLLLMSRRDWHAGPSVHYYGLSWSFIYYLTKQGRKDLLDTYFGGLMAGKSQQQAFDAVFGPGKVNLEELEAKWRLAVFRNQYEGGLD